MTARNILFIDRDGTLVQEPFDYQVDALDKIRLCKDVIPALLKLSQAGYQCVMVTNQDGLGTTSFPTTSFQKAHDFILDLFASQGIVFDDIFICPHTEDEQCACRKPKTGLLDAFLQQQAMNTRQSWVIGDRETDQQLATNLGVPYLPISESHDWSDVAETILAHKRRAHLKRETKETSIEMVVSLDGRQANDIQTPIAFFSHMLEQVARHGGFSLQLKASGDVEVDDHHLIEDTAITLGAALKQALGNKWGIARFGTTLPMDESLAMISIDLCGRAFCDVKHSFTREFIGGMATEMVPHFFKSFATSLGATVHVQVSGDNHHHMIEACFKALGRALNQAIAAEGDTLPSTKGVL
ncbi:MAG: bifunctional histidinol-phosphatase/imidazoleglycerol-phosphate dehydratase HisB [Gammaproteobacteria bacterium]|nr:bifunctional histidinol-phosphatase/imidazoleglycerol-phosphate dehydratase HisB [Gammaproteobacteria bacterium]